jgi:hypothetical protein
MMISQVIDGMVVGLDAGLLQVGEEVSRRTRKLCGGLCPGRWREIIRRVDATTVSVNLYIIAMVDIVGWAMV